MKKRIWIIIIFFLIVLESCSQNQNNLIKNISNNQTWTTTSNTGVNNEKSNWTGNIISNTGSKTEIESSYCLFDMCIPQEVVVKEENWFYLGTLKIGEAVEDEKTYIYKMSKTWDYFELNLEWFMHREIKKIFKIWENYIKSTNSIWCGGTTLTQKVIDKDGKEIANYLLPELSKNISIGSVIYTPTLVWEGNFRSPTDDYNNFKAYEDNEGWDKIFENEKTFKSFIEDQVLNVEKRLYKSYIAQYKKYPWVNVIYNSLQDKNNRIRTIYLWTDKNYLSKNIKTNGDFIDLVLTNKIIWYYGEESYQWIFDENGTRITKVDSAKLPFFVVKKFDAKWNYLIHLQPWYKLQSLAEMCKPVVYYYSDKDEENYLTLIPKKYDYFTHLIPAFNKENTWKFQSQNKKIKVEENTYDYLYYSMITAWYEHNRDGWIVSGNDIVNFFEDKLEKINFNTQEKSDFIDFWKGEYEKDKYYFVSFKYKEDLDKIVLLKFEKTPDKEFRVLLDSYEVNYNENQYKKYLYTKENKDIFDADLIQRFERGNAEREVFEWGGVLEKDDSTIIK